MRTIQRLVIANRGEIACRIIRTAKQRGITTLAVYSEADRLARHVKLADEAYYIGPAPAKESYLSIENLLDVAKRGRADAIHPGYGFLSESPAFAKACRQAGIVFVGPSPEAIEAMGNKSQAKALMGREGIPLIPGYHGADQRPETFLAEARAIGFPVLLKAAAGGGGKGMRIVRQETDFISAFDSAKREALSSFANDDLLLEKYLENPRHIEIQLFGDRFGHYLALHERDCSIQRRHQKVVEEAPAFGLSEHTRHQMAETAKRCAQILAYEGAGTIEFLVDSAEQFYFMEMNTRLQVEHPVTEAITGLDLVEWQLHVAEGQPLPLTQEAIPRQGHAIEVRLYAEDPSHDFLPATGRIQALYLPEANLCRVDTGIQAGDDISPYYDPLLAKLIVWGKDRSEACQRLKKALLTTTLEGLKTNLDFLRSLTHLPDFEAGHLNTDFIPHHQSQLSEPIQIQKKDLDLLMVINYLHYQQTLKDYQDRSPHYPWYNETGIFSAYLTPLLTIKWQIHGRLIECNFECRETQLTLTLLGETQETYHCRLIQDSNNHLRLEKNGIQLNYPYQIQGNHYLVFEGDRSLKAQPYQRERKRIENDLAHGLQAPMPGTLVAILVKPKESVEKGQVLVIMEAMKMEHSIRAPHKGFIEAIHYQVGDIVNEGNPLLVLGEELAE